MTRCLPLVLLAVAGAAALLRPAPAQLRVPARGFVSVRPATTWEEGLICGNGTIGANALSRPLDERIILTHERLFLPEREPVPPPPLARHLPEIRRLIAAGEYRRATRWAFELSGQPSFLYPDRFVPAFDLRLRTSAAGTPRAYARSVDFATGVARVSWTDERGTFRREMFVSRADAVLVLTLEGPAPGALDVRVDLEPRYLDPAVEERTRAQSQRVFDEHVIERVMRAEGSFLTWSNRFAHAYPGSIQGVEGVVRVVPRGGSLRVDGTSLFVEAADQVLLLVAVDVTRDARATGLPAAKARLAALEPDADALLARHVPLHAQLFDRVRLDLGGGADHALPTETLLERSSATRPNLALIEKVFDAGRYNILSCSGELPPTLQGVWGGTYVPGWASDYTHNGNVPSAIASLLRGNTPELLRAYTSYLESLVPDLERNARDIFGARGIVLPSRTSTHGFNNALAPDFAGAFWVAGAAWAAHFFYDDWLHTGDRAFLAEHALPFLEKAALFFEDYLVEGPDGRFLFSPTQSPENTPGNTDSQGTFNATMDIAAARELLGNLIEASRELGVNAERIPRWQAMRAQLPPYRIGPDGAIAEWATPLLSDRHAHRHSSHLYALFDGLPEEIERDPALCAAFRRLIEIKLDRHWGPGSSGFMSFGLVQLAQAATSLGEGELAWRCLVPLVDRYWLANLASMHNHRSLFNMDISGGLPAVLLKMLVESRPGHLRLLPALPQAFPSGTVTGVLCRGRVTVDRLHWTPTQVDVTLRSAVPQTLLVGVPFPVRDVAGTGAHLTPVDEDPRRVRIELGADTPAHLTWLR